MDTPVLFDPLSPEHLSLIPSFADIHIACIETDNTIATFLPPLRRDAIEEWWHCRVSEVAAEQRVIVMMLANNAGEVREVAGYVMLGKPVTETGPFRGSVEKLLVSPKFRLRGVARKLMQKLEEVAKSQGRTLLLLDTEAGSPAEKMYPKLGYHQLGVVPDYGISPIDGTLVAGSFFWKQL